MTTTVTNIAPKQTTVTTITDDQRYQAVRSFSSAVESLYSVLIYDLQYKKTHSPTDVQLGVNNLAEFYFTVPPKSYEISEPYATTIIPTQNSGRFIESHGIILRDITVSGTTGLRPNKLAREATVPFLNEIPLFGSALSAAVDDVAALVTSNPFGGKPGGLQNPKEQTGFDDIMFLRNIFRHYADLKAADDSSRYLMLWLNAKDADYWVVEPMTFKLVQDASSPMTYNYNIVFKSISKFDAKFDLPEDPQSFEDNLNNVLRKAGEADRVIRNSLFTIANQIDKVEALGIAAVTAVVSPAISLLRGINNIVNTAGSFGDAFAYNVKVLQDNVNTELNKLFAKQESGDLEPQDDIVHAMLGLRKATVLLSSSPLLTKKKQVEVNNGIAAAQAAYSIPGDIVSTTRSPNNTGDPANIGSTGTQSTYSKYRIQVGDNIKSLAKKLLGNASSWKVLVIINNLKYPYITNNRVSTDVLIPGDFILYPSTSGVSVDNSSAQIASNDETTNDHTDLSEVELSYGRDIRLETVEEGSAQLSDIRVDPNLGDYSTIVGVPNVEQALKIKFATEQGTLTSHPEYGSQFPVGTRLTAPSFNTFRIQAKSTLLSDPRIAGVKSINFVSTGDILVTIAKLQLAGEGVLTSKFYSQR